MKKRTKLIMIAGFLILATTAGLLAYFLTRGPRSGPPSGPSVTVTGVPSLFMYGGEVPSLQIPVTAPITASQIIWVTGTLTTPSIPTLPIKQSFNQNVFGAYGNEIVIPTKDENQTSLTGSLNLYMGDLTGNALGPITQVPIKIPEHS